jgi:Phage integrase family
VLRTHRRRQLAQRERHAAAGTRWHDSGYVFTRADGLPINPNYATTRFRKLVDRVGLPPVRLHDLRHVAASLAHEAGADLKTLQDLLGHSSIVITVEGRLMQAGMPYRSADPAAWEDGTLMFDPSHFGAHEVAPLSSDGSLRVWPKLGLTPPNTPMAPDLSNIDDVVDAALRGLNQ